MKIKTLALVLCALFCVGLSSCKDDGRQDLPKLSTSGVNSEDTGSSAKYTGPMTELQVSMTATYPAASKSRAFNTSFKQGSSDENLMQINWEKDKKYKLRVCVRPNSEQYSTSNPDGWNADTGPYADFTGTVISVSGETYTKDGKQYGTGGTLWIEGSIKVPTKYLTANNIYFAAFIYTDADNVQVDPKGPINFPLPKMIAVHNPQNNTTNTAPATIPTMSVLTAIPFTHVTFVKKGSDYKMVKADASGHEDTANKTYNIKPILTLFHFKLTNKLPYDIRIPEDTELLFPESSVAFGVGIPFDFWKFNHQVTTIGTDEFFFHFGGIYVNNVFERAVTKRRYSVGVDYSNVPENLQSTDGGKKYIQLQPNNSLDFYVAGAPVLDPTNGDNAPKFEIDFSNLKIQYKGKLKSSKWIDYVPKYRKLYCYADGMLADGHTSDGGAQFANTPEEDFTPLFFSAKNAAADNYKQGRSYYKSFDVEGGDLMFDLVGYKWDNVTKSSVSQGGNYGLIQLYNASNETLDLSKYYLVRTVYNYDSNNHKILFCSNGWDFTTYLGYAVMCPLVPKLEQNQTPKKGQLFKEVSPRGYNNGNVAFNDGQHRDTYDAEYPVYSVYSQLAPNMFVIVGSEGFSEGFTPTKIRTEYESNPSTVVSVGSTQPDWMYSPSNKDRYCGGFVVIRDGRKDSENNGDDWYQRVPGNAWSGVMARGNGAATDYYTTGTANGTLSYNMLNGWALVKRIDEGNGRHKFVIVDCYGPCPSKDTNTDATNASTFSSKFGKPNASPFVYLRNPSISLPRGADMGMNLYDGNGSITNADWIKYWVNAPYTKPCIGQRNR